jgi:hypothetical protein
MNCNLSVINKFKKIAAAEKDDLILNFSPLLMKAGSDPLAHIRTSNTGLCVQQMERVRKFGA